MARFCENCGSRLKRTTDICPNCGARRQKNLHTQPSRRRRHFLRTFLAGLLLAAICGCLTVGGLAYFGIIHFPFSADSEETNSLGSINDQCIDVTTANIEMQNAEEGTATIIVRMPDYELLFEKAFITDEPEQFLYDALAAGDYEVQEFVAAVDVTVEGEETIIHSDEAVKQLLEKALVDAVNALSEEDI